MLTARVGRAKMRGRQKFTGRLLICMLVLVPLVVFLVYVMKHSSDVFEDGLSEDSKVSSQIIKKPLKRPAEACSAMRKCPGDHFSFYIRSGAANAVPPKICIQNKLVLGQELNNAGPGINIVIMNGKTGEVTNTAFFDMYSGDVKPLIQLLTDVQGGSAVLMASFDDPATKLSEEARELVSDLGSSLVKSLGFRDSWGFVGGKGSVVKSNFEKFRKNDRAVNKYDQWPELIYLDGCIPKFLE